MSQIILNLENLTRKRLESNQIKIDEVRDQNEHIELTEEREEGEVIDSENENEGKNSEQNEKQNTFAPAVVDHHT
jgi:hypothetical protein